MKQALVLSVVGVCSAIASVGANAEDQIQAGAPMLLAQSESALDELMSNGRADATTEAAPEAVAAPAVVAERSGPAIEEVVVTARRRAESIQSVPLAVSAVSGDMLEKANVTDMNALSTQVPSLVIVPGSSGSKAIPTFAIRGQSQQELSILADPSVPVYFNDVVIERQQGINQALFDLEAVEVLKGPQGTLFGRNSTGGAINVKAKRPTDTFEGYVGGTWGNLGRFNTTAMVNQPLTDWAQLRVAGQTTDSDGYLYNSYLNRNVNYEHTKAGRISLALQPAAGVDSLFTYSRFIQNDGGTGAILTKLNRAGSDFPGEPETDAGSLLLCGGGTANFLGYTGDFCGERLLEAQAERGIYQNASGVEEFTRISTWDLANTTTWEINDNLTVKNIVGWREVTGGNYDDIDGSPVPFFQISRFYDFRQFSEEFQLMGNTDTTNWIVGLYYFNEKGGTDDYSATVKPFNAAPGNQKPQPLPFGFPGWSITDPDGENTSKSIFGQVTQRLDNLADGLALTVGARYTWDDRVAIVRSRAGNATDPNGPQTCRFSRDLDGDPSTPETPAAEVPMDQCVVRAEKSFSEPTYNVSLDYQYSPTNLVYLAHRRGYRTGGFGARASTESALKETYNAEVVQDIELGSKNDFAFGNGAILRLNVAIFYSDYTDIQRLLTRVGTLPIQTVPTNAGKATIKGGEVEFTFLPTDRLELSGFYSFTDAGYDEFIDPFSGEDRTNQPFARAPEHIYSLTMRYRLPLAAFGGEPSFQANYFYTDDYDASDTYAPQQLVEGYGLLNMRADWSGFLGSNFDVGVFLRNALDKEYLIAYGDVYSPPIGLVSRSPGEPRTYGIDVRYRFGSASMR